MASGTTNMITKQLMSMIKSRSNNNLPVGVVVNKTIVTPNKSKCILVILMNTNSYNIWICQSLLAADMVEADHCPWDYQSSFSCEFNEVTVTFHPVPSPEVQEGILSASVSNSAQYDSTFKDFTKADVSKGGKENILVLTDAFSKYSQAFVTSIQKSLMVAKLLVEKWFNVFGTPTRILSD